MSIVKRFGFLSAAIGMSFCTLSAYGQDSSTVRIAVSNDLSGVYSDLGGRGEYVAAKLAVEDYGGELLGKKIEVIGGDNQNKADIASQMARTWIDTKNVVAILSGGASSAGLATQKIASDKETTVLITAGFADDFRGKQCSPYSTQRAPEAYTLASGVTQGLAQDSDMSWFFVAPDYVFGKTLASSATKFIEEAQGEVLGQKLYPFPSSDFSSYILTAQSSGADVVGFTGAGGDLVTFVRQAEDFGVSMGGQKIAPFLVFSTDILSMGLEAAAGLRFVTPFYWNANEKTAAWTKRWQEATEYKHAPTLVHALAYESTMAYLAAVEEAGTFDSKAVNDKMRELPLNTQLIENARVRPEDGTVVMDMHLVEVKSPDASESDNDIYNIVTTIPGDKVYEPLEESECYLVNP